MAMQKIKVGDNVIVTTGREKGRTGKVLRVLNKENRVIVEGLNQFIGSRQVSLLHVGNMKLG